jgi:hypothetical protein
MITQQELHDVLEYNKDTGNFVWKVTVNYNSIKGSIAGTSDNLGYIAIKIKGKRYLAHRLVWIYVYGTLPNSVLDHVNGIPYDNRLDNLRLATASENCRNCKTRIDNTTGIKNVGWSKAYEKYVVRVKINNKSKHIGYFENIEDANKAAIEAREKYHGEFANHG